MWWIPSSKDPKTSTSLNGLISKGNKNAEYKQYGFEYKLNKPIHILKKIKQIKTPFNKSNDEFKMLNPINFTQPQQPTRFGASVFPTTPSSGGESSFGASVLPTLYLGRDNDNLPPDVRSTHNPALPNLERHSKLIFE